MEMITTSKNEVFKTPTLFIICGSFLFQFIIGGKKLAAY